MNPLKHKLANEWMRQDDASPQEALDTWNTMEAEFKLNRAMSQEPRTMAQGGRIGLSDGQLVTPTVDGSRPGYATSTVKKGKFKHEIINQHGTVYSDKKPKKYAHEVGSGKFSIAERNRITRIKFPEYTSYLDLLKKEPAKAKNVMAALQHSSIRGTKITKKTVFTPLTEIQQNKILLEFPDAVFSKGQKFGFNTRTDQTKFVQVKKFIDRGYKPRFKTLPLKIQNELKEKFSHFKDWDFDKFKYGVPETLNNVDNRRLMGKVKTYINDPKPFKFGFSLDQKGAWMTQQMYRAWEHGNTDYEPIYNKNDKVIGMKEKGKAYYANENVAPSKKAALINSHSEFNNIQKFVDVANEAKLPLKDLKGYKNTKALLALFPDGYEKIKFSDLTNYLYKEAGADATRNAIEKHHLKSLSDIGSATDARNLQLLRQDLNTLGNTVAEQIKKEDFSRVADLEKAGVKITVDGKTYGKGFQDPRKQLGRMIGQTTQKLKSLDKKQFTNLLEKLGCPKGGKASGGRVGFSTGTTCAIKGREVATRILRNGTATDAQKTILREMVGAGSAFLKGTAKFAGNILNPKEFFKLRNWVGPEAAAFMAAFEGGIIGYDVINNNTPIKEALGANWATSWAMPKTLDEYQIEEMRKKGDFSNESSERFAKSQELASGLNRDYEEIEFLKIDPTKSAEVARKQKAYDAKEEKYFSFVGEGKGMDPYEFEKDRGRMLEERGAGEFIPEENRLETLSGTLGINSEGKSVSVNEYGYADVADETLLKKKLFGIGLPESWVDQSSGPLPLKKSRVPIYDLPPSEIAKMPEVPFEQGADWALDMKAKLKDVHEIITPGDYRFADYEKLTEQDKKDLTNYYRSTRQMKENEQLEDMFYKDTGKSMLEEAEIAKKWSQLYNYPGMQGSQDPYAEGGIASLMKKK
jgi:hypothetical protein